MQVVLLDAETLGPDDLDFSPLSVLNHDLCCHQSTQPDEVVKRLAHAQIVLVNKWFWMPPVWINCLNLSTLLCLRLGLIILI